MLYKISFLQIFIYLFLAPLIRLALDKDITDYHFGIAFIFLFSFMIVGYLFRQKKHRISPPINIFIINSKKNYKWVLITIWIFLCAVISYKYSLYNRRIGTEVAAELFANISPTELIPFRTLEISLSFLMSIILLNINEKKYSFPINFFLLIIIIFAFVILGASSSRSATGLFILSVLLINQNKISTKKLFRLSYQSAAVAGIVFFVVTLFRLSTASDNGNLDDYIAAEVLQRMDGLEIVSKIIDKYGYHLAGINLNSIMSSLIAMIPFSDEAVQLKLTAYTTVKAVILDQELDSQFRDINSFIILDSYYWGGILGVTGIGGMIAYFSRLVDKRIGVTSEWIFQLFLVSIVINFVVLEREAIGIIFSVMRDWIVLCFMSIIFLSRQNQNSFSADYSTLKN